MLGWLLNLGFAASESGAVVVVAPAAVENSGGWPIYQPRRKKKEPERESHVEIILEDIPEAPQTPKRRRLHKPKPYILSQSEIDQIRQSVQGEIDQEIAIYLRAIEKRRRRNIALVLLLDAA